MELVVRRPDRLGDRPRRVDVQAGQCVDDAAAELVERGAWQAAGAETYDSAPSALLATAPSGVAVQPPVNAEPRQRSLPGIASGEVRGSLAFEPRSNDLVVDS